MTPPHSPQDSDSNARPNGATDANDAPDSKRNVVEMNPGAELAASATESDDVEPEVAEPSRTGSPINKILVALLLLSLGFHFVQAQRMQGLDRQSQELDLALDRSIERVDAETLRANRAENALQEVDRRVGTVNDRIVDLQRALSDLSEVTSR